MKHRAVHAIGTLVILVVSACLPAISAGIRPVGLRPILPFTGIPLLLGAEVVMNVSYGGLSFSLFLSPADGTLLPGSADIALAGDPSEASTFLRLTTGLPHFDSARRFPSILLGAGTSLRYSAIEPFVSGFAGKLIYPLAFPLPLFTLSGAWTLL
jgi:hypothetical protein